MVIALVLAGCASHGAGPRGPARPVIQEGLLAPGAHTFDSAGVKLAYHVAGHGPLLVALPGGPGLDGSYLRMPEVERHATVLYVQPVGSGASGRLPPRTPYTMQRDVEDLVRLREGLGLDAFVLLGHSYGGFVALRYALAHARTLRGLVLYATTATTNEEWQQSVGAAMHAYFGKEPWFAEAMAAMAAEQSVKTEAEAEALVERERPLYFADYSSDAKRYSETTSLHVALASMQRPPEAYDVRASLPTIQVPTVVVTGERDVISGERWSRPLHEAIRGSSLVILPRTGHMAHIEAPSAFASAITSLLR